MSDKEGLSNAQELSAGPVRLKFADGELRYLFVRDREIVRRVYFAVRDSKWSTALPAFDRIEVRHTAHDFTIDLTATCKTETADFSWKGRIEGKADGTITFRASGAGNSPFRSNRIGLCVLYGAPAVRGRALTTVAPDGKESHLAFPAYVSPRLVAPNFATLRYTTGGKETVTTNVSGDAHFDMEDQRTYSDSSFKAYAPLAYDYKQPIPVGRTLEEVVTISVAGANGARDDNHPLTLESGPEIAGARLPRLLQAGAEEKPGLFGDVNGQAEKHKGASALTWGFRPTVHLPDDDTIFENVFSIPDQVATTHTYAPGATITLSPVVLNGGQWPDRYTRSADTPMASAWLLAVVKEAALAGVAEVRFGLGAGKAQDLQQELAALAGHTLLSVTVVGGKQNPVPVDALCIDNGPGKSGTLFVFNRSAQTQKIKLDASAEPLTLQPFAVYRSTMDFMPQGTGGRSLRGK